MITYTAGDLLDADVDALVNTVNTVGVMGKGLALQFKRRFPDNFRQYAAACRRGEVRLGRMFVVVNSELDGPRYIINFPTKGHWRGRSSIESIKAGLDDLERVIGELGLKSLALPALGAGNGGLEWRDVRPVIEQHLRELDNVDVRVYPPTNERRSLRASAIPMTWARSSLIELIKDYAPRKIDMAPDDPPVSASHLEIQKLLYFANIAVTDLRLKFSQGNYGPYSDAVRHLIQEMEGLFVTGFGDGTTAVQELAPIAPSENGIVASDEFIRRTGKDVRRHLVTPTLVLIEGFEGPYELELLASTHWAATQGGARDATTAAQFVRSWTVRKARMFTDYHVTCAWEHLVSKELIPAV
ncbi:MAG TPA: macro domain-containing protein [Pseudonocardiaceae bacterium]|jgi:O-acetyl-ADP-ribose deacetylase (regulator of RNase III)